MSFEEDTDDRVLSLNEITLGFGDQLSETGSAIYEPKSPLEAMERSGSETGLSDGSSQRSETTKTSTFLRKTGSSARGLASFLRTSKETGLLKEISKANPSAAVIEELSEQTRAEAVSPTQQSSNRSVVRRRSDTPSSSTSSGAYKKIPMLPPGSARKLESTNQTPSSSQRLGSSSGSSSHTDVSSFNGDSISRGSHEGSPVSKPLANGDIAVSPHSGESSHRPLTNCKPLPPRPKPVGRSPSNSSSEDLRLEQGEPVGGNRGNRPVPKPRSVTISSTQESQNETSNDRNRSSTESDLSVRGEPKVQELKYENEILKHQIMHLKDTRSELEQENQILREVIQTSGEFSPTSSPIAARRDSSAVRGGVTPPPSKSPLPNSKLQGSRNLAEVDKVSSTSPSFSRINSFPGVAKPTPTPRSLNKSSSSTDVSQSQTQIRDQTGTRPKLPSKKPTDVAESIAEEKEDSEEEPDSPPLTMKMGTTSQAKQPPTSYISQRPVPAPRILAESVTNKPTVEGSEPVKRPDKESHATSEAGEKTVNETKKEGGDVPVRTQPDGVFRAGVTYKKVEIKSDESWIRSRKKSESDESDKSRETTPASSSVVSDTTQPPPRRQAPPRPQAPFRSVPIIGSSSPSLSQGSTPLGSGVGYVPPSVGLDRFYTPPSFKYAHRILVIYYSDTSQILVGL